MNAGARLAVTIVLVLATGFWGVVVTFSDSPTSWSPVMVAAYVAVWHIPGALIVGYLYSRKWWLGLLVCWGALLVMAVSAPGIAAATLLVAGVAAYLGRALAMRLARRAP